jgi:hypothetical protein
MELSTSQAVKEILNNLWNSKVYYRVRFEVSTAVTMKNIFFWDIKTRSYLTGNTLRLRYRAELVNTM